MRAQRRSRAGLALLVLLVACYSYFIYRGPMWNPDSRMALIFALVDRHSLSIDEYHEITEDKSFANGHYYSDKAVGTSLLGAPIYLLFKPGLFSSLPPEAYFMVRYLITFFVISIPSSLLGIIFFSFLPEFGVTGLSRLVATMGLSLGTIAFPYSTVFFGHQLAATLLFAAFVLIYRFRREAQNGVQRWSYLPLAGLLTGYAVTTEYPAMIAVIFLSLYAILGYARDVCQSKDTGASRERDLEAPGDRPVRPRGGGWATPTRLTATLTPHRQLIVRGLGLWTAGLLPPAAILMTYNTIAFGGPLSQGYAHLGGAPEFIQGMSRGFLGITYPSLSALWGITLSPYRGLFFLSPFLLLALTGWYQLRRGSRKIEACLSAAVFIAFLLFNTSYFQWDGGYSLGPRHLIPALPFLALLAAVGISRAPAIGALLVALSSLIIWLFMSTNPFPGPEYTNPLFDVAIPGAISGSFNNNWGMAFGLRGVSSLLPLLLIVGLALFATANRLRQIELPADLADKGLHGAPQGTRAAVEVAKP